VETGLAVRKSKRDTGTKIGTNSLFVKDRIDRLAINMFKWGILAQESVRYGFYERL